MPVRIALDASVMGVRSGVEGLLGLVGCSAVEAARLLRPVAGRGSVPVVMYFSGSR